MNNIAYQTKKIRIEKILREEQDPETRENVLVTYYQGYARVSIPYTFGLLKKWVVAGHAALSETKAASMAAVYLFNDTVKIPNRKPVAIPRHVLLAAANNIKHEDFDNK